MTPRDRDGSFTHTHGVMPLFPTGVKKVNCGRRGSSENPAFFYRCTKDSNVDPAEVSKNGRFCTPFPSRCLRKLTSLPDHLIRLEQDLGGYRETKGLGSLEVDHELNLHGALDGQVPRLGALENFVHVHGSLLAVSAAVRRVGK